MVVLLAGHWACSIDNRNLDPAADASTDNGGTGNHLEGDAKADASGSDGSGGASGSPGMGGEGGTRGADSGAVDGGVAGAPRADGGVGGASGAGGVDGGKLADGEKCATDDDCASNSCGFRCCKTGEKCVCPQPSGNNLLKNPGFDSSLAGWTTDTGPGGYSWEPEAPPDNNNVFADADSCPFSGAATSLPRPAQAVSSSGNA